MGKHLLTATVYDKRGNVLTQAQNNYLQTHPIQARFAEQVGQPSRIYLHAEIAALVKLRKGQRPYKIVIERKGKDDRPRLAKPCPVCEAAIKFYGLKRVEYTL